MFVQWKWDADLAFNFIRPTFYTYNDRQYQQYAHDMVQLKSKQNETQISKTKQK